MDDLLKLLLGGAPHSVASLRKVVSYFWDLGPIKSEIRQRKPFMVHPHPLGPPPGLSYDNVEALIEVLEGGAQVIRQDCR
jgi:hypothetical protein